MNKVQSLVGLSVIGFFVSTPSLLAREATTFHCLAVRENGYPVFATVARRGLRQTSPLIVWRTQMAEFSPQERCKIVSQRLNDAVAKSGGKLSSLLLTYGSVREQTVICYLTQGMKACNSNNLLFTLNSQNRDRGKEILQAMVTFGQSGSGSAIYESTSDRAVVYFGEEIERAFQAN
jgi:hypothetical protein